MCFPNQTIIFLACHWSHGQNDSDFEGKVFFSLQLEIIRGDISCFFKLKPALRRSQRNYSKQGGGDLLPHYSLNFSSLSLISISIPT